MSGTKRIESVAASSSADVPVTLPIAFHVTPLSSEYCHVPDPAPEKLAAVIAMPSAAPEFASETVVPRNEATVCPEFETASSSIVLSEGLPAVSTGAALGTDQERLNVAAPEVSWPPFVVPPSSWTLNVKLVLAAETVEVNCNFPASMSVTDTVRGPDTVMPLYFSVPAPGAAVMTTLANLLPLVSTNGKSVVLNVYVALE